MYYIFLILILAVSGVVGGCATSNENHIQSKSIPNLTQAETGTLFKLLEQYKKYFLSEEDIKKDQLFVKQLKDNGELNVYEPIPSQIWFSEIIDLSLIEDIKEKRISSIINTNQTLYFLDIGQLDDFTNKFITGSKHKFPVLKADLIHKFPFRGRFMADSYTPSYIHYIQQDGSEIRAELNMPSIEFYREITPVIQTNTKAVIIDYFFKAVYPREGAEYLIKGKHGVATIDEKTLLRYEWGGSASIPEGKVLFIECRPFGDNLPANEQKKRFIAFVAFKQIKVRDTHRGR